MEKNQVEKWLFLKQECEECLITKALLCPEKQLGPIQELDEPVEIRSESETSYKLNSDNETDSETQNADFIEKLDVIVEELELNNNNLVKDKYIRFIESHSCSIIKNQTKCHRKGQPKLTYGLLKKQKYSLSLGK